MTKEPARRRRYKSRPADNEQVAKYVCRSRHVIPLSQQRPMTRNGLVVDGDGPSGGMCCSLRWLRVESADTSPHKGAPL